MPSQIITVLEHRLEETSKEVSRLVKKAKKHGFDDLDVTVHAIRFERRETHYRRNSGVSRFVDVPVVDIEVTWGALVMGPFDFVARVEMTDSDLGHVVYGVPGRDVDTKQYRHCSNTCDHCGTKRKRKDVYIVYNRETGVTQQVGGNCLRDYMGIDPAKVLAKFNFFKALQTASTNGSGGWEEVLETEQLLAFTAVAIRKFGWTSGGAIKAYMEKAGPDAPCPLIATATDVRNMMYQPCDADRNYDARRKELLNALSDEDYEVAQKTLNWVRTEMKGDNDYCHNLRVILSSDVIIGWRKVNFAVSAVAGYQRAMGKLEQRKKEVAASNHIGEVGDRLRKIVVTQTMTRFMSTGLYGDRYLVKFKDPQGNEYAWFTIGGSGKDNDRDYVISGTVKKHTEFKGLKQTELTRVQFH